MRAVHLRDRHLVFLERVIFDALLQDAGMFVGGFLLGKPVVEMALSAQGMLSVACSRSISASESSSS